jgi:hypothetical protein
LSGACYGPDGSVHAGGVSAAGEHPDPANFFIHRFTSFDQQGGQLLESSYGFYIGTFEEKLIGC